MTREGEAAFLEAVRRATRSTWQVARQAVRDGVAGREEPEARARAIAEGMLLPAARAFAKAEVAEVFDMEGLAT